MFEVVKDMVEIKYRLKFWKKLVKGMLYLLFIWYQVLFVFIQLIVFIIFCKLRVCYVKKIGLYSLKFVYERMENGDVDNGR